MTSERRKYPRAKVSIPVEWGKTPVCEQFGDKVTRLSIGGCFIQTEQETQRDEIIFLRLWETTDGRGVLKCQVIYQFRIDPRFPPIGLGVKFIELDEEEESHLRHMLEFCNATSETPFVEPSYPTCETRV